MNIKRLISSVLGAAAIASSASALTGCMTLEEYFTGQRYGQSAQQALTNREWLNMVNDAYGVDSSDVNDEELIEDAKDWGIIDEDEVIDLDAPAEEEFVTTTLARAAGFTDSSSSYEDAVKAVEEHGLKNSEVDLSQPDTAQTVLEKVREDMVHPHFEDHREIVLADNVHDLSGRLKPDDVKINGDVVTMPFNFADEMDKDHVFILPGEEYGDEASYKVIAIVDNGDDTADVKCVPAKLCEVYKSVDVSGHFPADLKEFIPADNSMITVLENNPSAGKYCGYSKEKLTSEETDSINFSTELSDGTAVKISVKDIVLNTKIDWYSDNGKPVINRIFLSADYISDVSIESPEEDQEMLTIIGAEHPVTNLLKQLPSEIGKVPVHICDGLTVYLDLSLSADADGDLSVKVKTGETNGFEMKGAKFRTINSVLDLADIRTDRMANEVTTINIAVGMDYLLDDEEFVSLDIKSGPEVKGEATVHNHAGENDEKLVCVDVSGFLKVAMNANFCDAVIENTGLDPTLKLLDLNKEKSRVKWDGLHYENGKLVDACTFVEYTLASGETTRPTSVLKGRLEIDSNFITINQGESYSVTVTSLPSGYSEADLVWTSDNESIVTVDAKGNVVGVGAGTGMLSVSTKDGAEKLNFTVRVNS